MIATERGRNATERMSASAMRLKAAQCDSALYVAETSSPFGLLLAQPNV
jgi:hypothetical protein